MMDFSVLLKYTYILLLLILSFVNQSHSVLKSYDKYHNELASFYNVDLPIDESYTEVTGKFFVVSFNETEQDPCKISKLPNDVNILVVPFQKTFDLGCKSYANILASNSWTKTIETIEETESETTNSPSHSISSLETTNEIVTSSGIPTTSLIPRFLIIKSSIIRTRETHSLPSPSPVNEIQKSETHSNDKNRKRKRGLTNNNTPKMVIFSSSHNGIPGIREVYNGDIRILRTSIPSITLINSDDIESFIKIVNDVTYVKITADEGPWIKLVKSDSWNAFSIAMSVLDLLVVVITIYLITKTYIVLGCTLFNPKYWIYSGLGIASTFSFIILEIDPGDIYQDKLSIPTKELLCDLRDFLLVTSYVILHISWENVTKKICIEKQYHLVTIHRFFKITQPISASAFIMCIILRLVYEGKPNSKPRMDILKVIYSIESIALGLIGLGLLSFGGLMILALRRRRQRIKWCSKQIRIVLMTFFMVISIVMYIRCKSLVFLALTVENFRKEQFAHNIITVLCCTIMIFILEDKYIERYLPSNTENPRDIALTSIPSNQSSQPS